MTRVKPNKSYLLSFLTAASLLAMSTSIQAHNHGMNANKQALKTAIEQRSDEDRARDQYRHPKKTLSFFNVAPGMTVAEALPGGGWYSKILAPYLGKDGGLYGVNYADDMWARFGFFSEDRIAKMIARTDEFPNMVAEFGDSGVNSKGFTFATVPSDVEGKVDRVLFVRALHNLVRFEDEAGTLTQALQATKKMLKKDGMVGVVQHRAPETASDESSKGQRGYVKQSYIIQAMQKAGFELVDSSEMNANPKDQPSESDIVWRLPPSLNGSKDNPELKAKMQAIGESDRMTLLFKLAK